MTDKVTRDYNDKSILQYRSPSSLSLLWSVGQIVQMISCG